MENPGSNYIPLPPSLEDVNQDSNGVDIQENCTTKKVHQFYFPMILSYGDPTAESAIAGAEKRMEKLNRDYLLKSKRYKETRSDIHDSYVKEYRVAKHCHDMGYCKKLGDLLQEALDKLSSTEAAAKGTESSDPSLHFQMQHGSKSLAEEKMLLRQTMASLQKDVSSRQKDVDFRLINWQDVKRIFRRRINNKPIRNLLKKAEELEKSRAKAIAKAALQGNNESHFCLMKSMENEVKVVEKVIQILKKETSDGMGDGLPSQKNMEDLKKKQSRLMKEIDHLCKRWDEERKYILALKNKRDKANAAYNHYLSTVENARELAMKKDVQGLEQLSHREVYEFMSEWNSSDSFRHDYKVRILQSLYSRGLSGDGRVRVEESAATLEPKLKSPAKAKQQA